MSATTGVGWFGKLPSHGDFVSRRVSETFVAAWDGWLQRCLAASRTELGDRWLNVYLTSPAWRFACASGACGPAPVAGVMVPSVDRVGRYFPLTVVAELPGRVNPVVAAARATAFFEGAERLSIETLESERIDFERFDHAVEALAAELEAIDATERTVLEVGAAAVLDNGAVGPWQIPLASSSELEAAMVQMLGHRVASLYEPCCVWWTEGSSIVEPGFLLTQGLPAPESFVSLLDGSWGRRWRSIGARILASPTADAPTVAAGAPPRLRSAGQSDVGRVRKINQDAFLDRPEAGLWVVADGLGGHSEGEVASRMVCDALADFVPHDGFDAAIEQAGERIKDVNQYLVRKASRSMTGERSGSTVVVLMVRGPQLAVLWAGDSRAYRWRSGQLERLTRDHSAAEEDGADGVDSHAVTRAVGGDAELDLDVYRDEVRAGDRFLLCSDGLTRTVSTAAIRAWLEAGDVREAAGGLIEAALSAGAPDNVTAVVVEAFA